MSVGPSGGSWLSRETRLLLLTVAVCAIALVGLARLRFPEQPVVVTTTPPLERLAARASYDELAADIRRVEGLISPNLVVLRMAPPPQTEPRAIRDALAQAGSPSRVRHVAALRIRTDAALAVLEADARIEGVAGATGPAMSADVVAADPVRRIAYVRVPDAPVRPLPTVGLAALRMPLYVVVVEGTEAGVTLRPVFLGRGDRFDSVRWSRPLLPLGGSVIAPGALLFTLAGEFIGTAVIENGVPAVVEASDVVTAAEAIGSRASSTPADPGITVQGLTPTLAAALDVSQGVVVSEVDPHGSAAGLLEVQDVITTVDGRPIGDPDALLLNLASRGVGERVVLTVTRGGQPQVVTMPLGSPDAEPAAPQPLVFSVERGLGARVETAPEASGLAAGDVVTRAGTITAPTPAQLRRLLMEETPSAFVTLVVRRDGRQRIVAVPVEKGRDGTEP